MLLASLALADCPVGDDLDTFIHTFVASRPDRAATLVAVDAARRAIDAVPRVDPPMVELMAPPVALAEGMPGARVRVEQPLPLWGMVRQRQEMARAAADAEAARADMMDLDMARMAAMLWTELWAMNAEATLMVAERERMDALRRATLDQYNAGRGSSLDLAGLDVEIAMMDLEIDRMAGATDTMRARVASLVGCEGLRVPPPGAGGTVASQGGASVAASLVDVVRAEGAAMVAMAEADRGMAQRATLPMIGWMLDLDTMVPAHEQLMVGVSVEVPLAWRAAKAGRDAADARVRVATATTEGELASLAADRAELVATVASAEQALRRIDEAVAPASARRLTAARAAYAAGTTDLRTLLAAQAGDVRVEIERVRTRAVWTRATAELAIVGGAR